MTISSKQFTAALGFAFVAVWITLGFGWAFLCLIGALAFYLSAVIIERALESTDFLAIIRGWGSSETPNSPSRPGVR